MHSLALLPLALLLHVPRVPAQEGPPAVFTQLDLETALARSAEEGRTLILDAMTSWCAPCKQMDRTTWVDPRLVAWVGQHGLAIQLDMDEHSELKEALGITAFPTLVLFREGSEYDRVVGFRSADAMLDWLGAAQEGKRARDLLLERLAALRASSDAAATWEERSRLAQDLVFAGLHAQALAELLWLHDSLAPDLRNRFWVRHFHDARDLAGGSKAAREAFVGLRAALSEPVAGGSAGEGALRDWMQLGFVVGDEGPTFDWADAQARTPAGLRSLRRFEALLFEPLVAAGRWRTAGLVLENPARHVRFLRDTLGAYDQPLEAGTGNTTIPAIPMISPEPRDEPATGEEDPTGGRALPMIPMGTGASTTGDADRSPEATAAEVRRRLTEQFRSVSATRYAALLAADREPEALEVATLLIGELDDARARTALVAAALRAGALDRARERHQAWLDQAAR